MLEILVPDQELFDDKTSEFVYYKGGKLILEHSLLSVSKWEAKWKKPFLDDNEKTLDEIRDYVRCMTLNKVSSNDVYKGLTYANFQKVLDYIKDSMTATWFSKESEAAARRRMPRVTNEKVTSELIYYWMITMGIPFECEKWHIGRLMTLLKIAAIKNQGGGGAKMTPKERALLNEQRKLKHHTRG